MAVDDESLLQEIERLANEIEDTPRVVDMREQGRYSPTAYYNHFGSWNKALKEVGYQPNGESITEECHHCANPVTLPRNRVERQDRVFCDGCESKWRSEYYSGPDSPRWSERIEVACENCGVVEKRKPHRVKDRDYYFCSRDCQNTWVDENFHGEDNPNWKGGATMYTNYGPNWQEKRQIVIESQAESCRVCDVDQDSLDKGLHVHHIKPVNTFKNNGSVDWEAANKESNLVALCGSCHRNWEGLPILPNSLQ